MDSHGPTRQSIARVPNKGLLALPAELREQIYSLIVIKPRNTITMLSNHSIFASEISATQPALSHVNHQLRRETLDAFYGSNVFVAEVSDRTDLGTALRWLSAIGDVSVGRLRRLVLCGWTRVPFGHMMVRRWVKVSLDLRDGTIEFEDCETLPHRSSLMRAIEDMRESFRALVAARDGGFDAESLGRFMRGFHNMCEAYSRSH